MIFFIFFNTIKTVEKMTAAEKTQIYNLLKTASKAINGYTSQIFTEENPVFYDDITDTEKKFSSENTQSLISPATKNQISSEQSVQFEQNTSLDSIIEKIKNCTRCSLCKTRHNTVAGIGSTTPYVLVIGEGPGYEEDMQGLPFVGPAGQLLDKMLGAIELSRKSNTYIANIVKCRPPQNRVPYPEEAQACISFLQAQIALLKPKMIFCFGTTAAKNLLGTELGVTRLRGTFHEYAGIPVGVTFHPSALLRDESLKRGAWEDLKMFKSKLLQIAPDYQQSFKG